jgi:YgiT-type zinc finger domain-containing protein
MSKQHPTETMEDRLVTYTVEADGRIIVIEHVPARVCIATGEQFFSPETVERIHAIVRGDRKPARTVQTPVYEFAA